MAMLDLDTSDRPARAEETLDPADWEVLRLLGHRMVDDALRMLATVRDRPAWQPVPEEVVAAFRAPLPREGREAAAVYGDYRRLVEPYPVGNIHPRFWGWVIGSGSPFGALAELLAATLNPNMSGLRNAGVHVEEQVLAWSREMMGFPETASGVLVSGGSEANTFGLAVGLQAKAGFDIAREGVLGAPGRPTLYASAQTHYSVEKSVRLLGLGSESLRLVPVDADFRIDLGALEALVAQDRAAGMRPFGVVGTAGTVNTGAFDDLEALAGFARREDLWFHIDGAFGAWVALAPEWASLAAGMAEADSLAFDFHKWLHTPIEAACVLVRDAEAHHATFAAHADYLEPLPRGIGHLGGQFANLGPQLTRGFRALKIWMSIKAHGVEAFGRLVAQNIRQARYLADRIVATPALELMAPVPSNVVCFRYRVDGDGAASDALNREIVMRLQERGIAVPSQTLLHGRFAIRVCVANHRSRREDFDILVDAVVALGREIAAAG